MVFGVDDDIIYVFLLLTSILIGKYYKQVEDVNKQKWIGTCIGLLIIFIVSGLHILHIIFSTFICSLIILYVNKRKCHIISFAFMFSYLLFFRTCTYFGFPTPPGHTNLVQMILTLKCVGLAFEINTINSMVNLNPKEIDDYEQNILNITAIDIIHYCFNYMGILTGPYFRYRTYYDYFTLPFKNYANCGNATKQKLMYIPICAFLYVAVSYIWPLSYATSAEFYADKSIFYRLMFIWPSFLIFRMRIYIGIILSECACTMTGFGAYPVQVESSSGAGPTKEYISILNQNPEKFEYDFETIRNVDVHTTETSITFRETMKSWNMCIQYWLAVNVYKRFPSKKYRTFITLIVSAYWHGVYSGYYLCIVGAPFYLAIEDILHKVLRKDTIGIKRRFIDCFFWISKFFAFSYLGIAFLLLQLDKIWYYYNSIFHIGYIYFAVMYMFGMVMLKSRSTKPKSS